MLGRPGHIEGKCSLNEFVKKSDSCMKHVDFIDKNYGTLDKKNITVGFGFVSHNNGLSIGLPIDVYTMLLTTEKARRQVLQEGAKVHIIIGDHLAFACQHPTCHNNDDVLKVRNKYIKKIRHILTNLNIAQHYQIHLTSDIVKTAQYRDISQHLETQARKLLGFKQVNAKQMISQDGQHSINPDTWNILNTVDYDPSNRAYFLDQTAVVQYMFDILGCGIKVSWAKARQSSKINYSVSFDEPHFDRFYRDMYFDQNKKISFVYTKPGFAANRGDEYAKVIPYTAARIEGIQRLLLTSKQKLPLDGDINPDLRASINMNVKYLKEIKQEVETQVVSKETDIETFYKNVSYLKSFARNPEKHLLIEFNDKLKIAPEDEHDKLGKTEPAKERGGYDK